MTRLIQLGDPGVPLVHPEFERLAPLDLPREAPHGDVIWFLVADLPDAALEALVMLRRLPEPARYLQPVVRVTDAEVYRAHTLSDPTDFADDRVSREQLASSLDDLQGRFSLLHRWLQDLPNAREPDEQLGIRLLRHLASRDAAAVPVPSADYASGFVYPALMPYFEAGDTTLFDTLAFLEQQSFLASEFVARAHFCFHCDCAFLNFEEVCVQCEAADLEVQELVHHFRCGHVAPMAEYGRGAQLVCSKCGRELRHIGVDYDKPSSMYRCNSCDHRMQSPDVRCTCYRCGRATAPENERSRRIARYELTPLGENAARYGVSSLFTSILERDVGLVPWPVLSRLVALEQARIQRFERTRSSLLCVQFPDIERIYVTLGARAPQVFETLGRVFSQVLRTTDVVSTRNDSLYVVLALDTDVEEAEIPRQRLVSRLREALAASLETPPEIDVRLMPVDAELDLEKLLNGILASPDA